MRAGMLIVLLSLLLFGGSCDAAAVNLTQHHVAVPPSNLLIRPSSHNSDPNSHRLPSPVGRQRSPAGPTPTPFPPSPRPSAAADLDLLDPSQAPPDTLTRHDLLHETLLPFHNDTLRAAGASAEDLAVGSGDGELPDVVSQQPDVFTVAHTDAFGDSGGITLTPLDPNSFRAGVSHSPAEHQNSSHAGLTDAPTTAFIPEIEELTSAVPETFPEVNETLPNRETNFLRGVFDPEAPSDHHNSSEVFGHLEKDPLKIVTSRVHNETSHLPESNTSRVFPAKTTNNSMAMYQLREHRILDAATPENVDNTTSPWKIALLPEDRNPEVAEQGPEAHPEGWTPFTIPHSNLPQFLFSTLMMEPLASSTEPTHVMTTTEGRRLATIVEEDLTTMETTTATTTTTTESTTTTATTSTTTRTTGRVVASTARETTRPRPMIFWSDKPETGKAANALFEDEGLAGSEAQGVSAKDTLDYIPKQNLSRDALDNLITILLKYVGQPEFVFDATAKKRLAEMVFWPIIYAPSSSNVSTTSPDVVEEHRMHPGVLETEPVPSTPWPVLRFIAPSPKLLDSDSAAAAQNGNVWLVTAYAVYKDTATNTATVMPRARLLTLVYESELKLMQKMSLQLSRVYPGIPSGILSLNETKPADTAYHPLFERFSSLFIPLIVLAAICVFVAVITVACLVKKAQTARHEQHLKDTHEKILRPLDVMGVDNPISDEMMKAGELRPHSNGTGPPGAGAGPGRPVNKSSVAPLPPRGAPHANGSALSAKERCTRPRDGPLIRRPMPLLTGAPTTKRTPNCEPREALFFCHIQDKFSSCVTPRGGGLRLI
ncbi:uncharacterized protein LOC129588762 isoform X2 [Paramacrobiotus metropolitanus]|uniref:uncharacterized protein LOC129588762 isoform X2 n=1 Tax=Paramacrobiotus metropolitanus TaxID=2943436 RepID=UPI0024457D5C|nr:uncharacterized protein LOC129588762 isoform X2 [Paramacrobiotus metropolitanus]